MQQRAHALRGGTLQQGLSKDLRTSSRVRSERLQLATSKYQARQARRLTRANDKTSSILQGVQVRPVRTTLNVRGGQRRRKSDRSVSSGPAVSHYSEEAGKLLNARGHMLHGPPVRRERTKGKVWLRVRCGGPVGGLRPPIGSSSRSSFCGV